MKALTIKQPWAYLIIHGGKDIENRTWRTKYRGRILIHAAKADDKKSKDADAEVEADVEADADAETEVLSELEAMHQKEPSAKNKLREMPTKDYQLSIFEMGDPRWDAVKEILGELDLNSTTPMEALMKLEELKKIL